MITKKEYEEALEEYQLWHLSSTEIVGNSIFSLQRLMEIIRIITLYNADQLDALLKAHPKVQSQNPYDLNFRTNSRK